jgi:lipoprotein-anchoring transpeptidase ErfK/SrfK
VVDAAGDNDGVRLTTNVGEVYKWCKPLTGERYLEVNLSTQTIIAWHGSVRINSSLISSGKDGFWTPAGTFYINARYRYKDMAGCEGGECWYVPDVQYAQYFTDEGHAIHAATWHNDFGIPRRSHGCINVPLGFAAWLWDWSTYDTRVWIHY